MVETIRGESRHAGILHLTLYDTDRALARDVPLRFIEIRGRRYVLHRAAPSPEWVAQATASSLVRWNVGSHQFMGSATSVHDTDVVHREVMTEALANFGGGRLRRWFGGDVRCVALTESPEGLPYYRAVEALFDQSAAKYDQVVQGNQFDRYLRTVALERLRHEGVNSFPRHMVQV